MSELVAISSLAEINPTNERPRDINLDVSFIPMADVTESAAWINRRTRKAGEVCSGFTSFKDGDVLFAKITPCMENGKGALARGLKNGVGYGSTEFHVIRAKKDVSPEFLNQFLKYQVTRERALAYFTGSAGQQRVSKDFFDRYLIPNFSFDEQNKIAQILDSIDEKVELTEELIKKKRLVKKGLLAGLLEKYSEGAKKTIVLRELLYGVRGVSYTPNQLLTEQTDSSFTLLRSNNIKDNLINFDSIQLVPEKLVSDMQRATPGDIAVCMSNGSRSLVGKSAAFSDEINGLNITVGAFCSIFKPINRADSSYLKHLFQSSIYQKHIDIVLAGSAINNLQNKVIEELRIPDIDQKSRHKIGDFLDAADHELNSIIHCHEKLESQKQGLMQDLLTGRVRVN